MKKLFLLFILVLPLFLSAQVEETMYSTYKVDTISRIKQKSFTLEQINGTTTDFELPYLRYCLSKSSNFKTAAYVLGGVSSVIALLPVFYTEEKFKENYSRIDWDKYRSFQTVCLIGSLSTGAAGYITLLISEAWFKKASIKPTLNADGVGITIVF